VTVKQRIVAEFDYHGPDGELLYQVVRQEPGKDGGKKDFSYRRPDGKGGWVWNIKGVKRVPYRLPELLAAPRSFLVFIPEGEKKVDVLRSMDCVATCSPMGAGKWLDDYNQYLQDRNVVLLPDNDKAGRDHIKDVASKLQGIARLVLIVELPDLPEKGDVVDWVATAGNNKERLLELAATAEAAQSKGDAWEDERDRCEPAAASVPEYVPFPVECLPEPIASLVQQGAVAMGCDHSYVALPALAVAASAIGNTRTIQLKRGWQEPSVIWCATVGDSGTMKSPALTKAVGPLYSRQRANLVKYRDDMVVYNQKAAQHRASMRSAGNGASEPARAPEAPILDKVVCSDVTVEKLAEILEDNPRGILVARDELAGWFGSFTKYKSNGGTDLPQWLEMFRAGHIVVDRKGGDRKNVYVHSAAVSICGTIQPGTLARALTPEFLEAGLGARVLMAMPPKTLKRWSEVEIHPDVEAAYCQTIERLLSLDFHRDLEAKPRPYVLQLTSEAKEVFTGFYDELAQRQLGAGKYMGAVLSKLEGYAARLALLHHVVGLAERGEDDRITVGHSSMEAGIALAKWFAAEAERIEGKMGDGAQKRRQQRFIDIIRDQGGRITPRDFKNFSSRQFETTEQAELALDAMTRAGLGHWEDKKPGPQGGRPTKIFVLNPGAASGS
jgi:hypothetical protein